MGRLDHLLDRALHWQREDVGSLIPELRQEIIKLRAGLAQAGKELFACGDGSALRRVNDELDAHSASPPTPRSPSGRNGESHE